MDYKNDNLLECDDPTIIPEYDPVFIEFGKCYYINEQLIAGHPGGGSRDVRDIRNYLAHQLWWDEQDMFVDQNRIPNVLGILDGVKRQLNLMPVAATSIAPQREFSVEDEKYAPLFLKFGQCYYQSEQFRVVLCTLLAWCMNPSGMNPRTGTSVHNDVIDKLLVGNFSTVTKKLKKYFDAPVIDEFRKGESLRNFLAHGFWSQSKGLLSKVDNLPQILENLNYVECLLVIYVRYATKLFLEKEQSMGQSAKIAGAEWLRRNGFLLDPPQLTRTQRRNAEKMRRSRQRLLRVWECGWLPIQGCEWYFELADNFLWRVSERQLEPFGVLSHSEIESKRWVQVERLSPYLPAEIWLTPEKINDALDYEIPVARGGVICVKLEYGAGIHFVRCFLKVN